MEKKTYTLMNKNHLILDFTYDLDTHRVIEITKLKEIDFAPLAILDAKKNITRSTLNSWWEKRAIPASRAQIEQLIALLNIDSTLALAEKNFGLSLSDRYWINDTENPQNWNEINFFDNDFTDDLGFITLGQDSLTINPNLMSPNSTVGGDLNKKWVIKDGVRTLIKSGSGFVNQEVYNEVIATLLHQRLLESGDFVHYSLFQENNRTYSACANMLGKDEELIPALHIIQNKKKPNSQNDYQFLVSCFKNLGLKNAEEYLSKMLTCDAIIGNFDRHYQNFGVIRNVETLEYTRFAPIFDTGNCLWCNVESLATLPDCNYTTKPFGRNLNSKKQLQLLSHFEWFQKEKLIGFTEEAREILSKNPNMPEARLEQVIRGIENQIKIVVEVTESH